MNLKIKCKNYAFENNLSDSLISMIHVENIGSEKVALKNPFPSFK